MAPPESIRRRFGVGPLVFLFAAVALAVISSPGVAEAWWNEQWSMRKKITLDEGPSGAGIVDPIGRTQVLVRLHEGNFRFADAKEDGSDIRFIAGDDKTPLAFHIESYDSLIGLVGLIWVDVPDMVPGQATSLYMYFGNAEAGPGEDPKGTYDPDQVLVYHFAEQSGAPRDQTAYGNNAVTAGQRDEAGLIGFGLRLDGSTPIQVPPSASLALEAGQALTLSAWIRPDAGSRTAVIFAAGDPQASFTVGLQEGIPYAEVAGPGGLVRTLPGQPLKDETWHHLTVLTGDRLQVFIDGALAGEVAASLPAMAGPVFLGGRPFADAPQPPPAPTPAQTNGTRTQTAPAAVPAPVVTARPNFVGQIDAFKISRVARPLGSIQAAARSQGLDNRLVAYDIDEVNEAFGTGYFGILIRAVTFDGWVVIIICGLMAVVSWLIMVSKAFAIGRVARGNDAFRAVFAEVAPSRSLVGAGISSDDNPVLERSSLYRLYEVAKGEVATRLQDMAQTTGYAFGPQAIASIRSSVEAKLVRETQSLNRQMVMLTIAISGGPFLGLLGTVIGVMITFAAVAAAGDVNVNAIAPGIAAALVATVAGLGVAIPALFAYNYFIVRIKEITADMQVFVNEIVARAAEITLSASYPTGE